MAVQLITANVKSPKIALGSSVPNANHERVRRRLPAASLIHSALQFRHLVIRRSD